MQSVKNIRQKLEELDKRETFIMFADTLTNEDREELQKIQKVRAEMKKGIKSTIESLNKAEASILFNVSELTNTDENELKKIKETREELEKLI